MRRPIRVPIRIAILTTFLVTAVAPAQNQKQDQRPVGSFSERVDVDLVQLEVRVTDADGRHVSGLGRDDFQVEIGGKKVELSLFSEVHLAAQGTSADPGEAVQEPVHVLLLVDQVHLDGGLSEEALATVGSFLGDVCGESGRGSAAVLEATAGGLSLVQPFTTDAEAALAALRGLDLRPSPHSVSAEYRRLSDEIRRVGESPQTDTLGSGDTPLSRDEMPGAVKSQIDAVAQRALEELARMALQIDRAISGLAGLPGRKSLVFVTGSLPSLVARELNTKWNDTFGYQSAYASRPSLAEQTGQVEAFHNPAADVVTKTADTGEIFDLLARQANAQGVTLHVLGSVINTEASQRMDDPRVLDRMARRTGGRSVVGANAHRVLDDVAADLGSYYVLAFAPPAKLDAAKGPFDVDVELGRRHRGLGLQHRESVQPTNLEQRSVQSAVSALLVGAVSAGDDRPGVLRLVVEPPTEVPGRDDVLRLPATVFIPLGGLDFVESGGVHQGRVSLFFTTGDLEHGASAVQKVEVPLRLAAEQLEGAEERSIEYKIDVPMAPDATRVAVALRDDLSGDILAAAQEIQRLRVSP